MKPLGEYLELEGLYALHILWIKVSLFVFLLQLVALVIGFVHYKLELGPDYNNAQPGHFNTYVVSIRHFLTFSDALILTVSTEF